MASTNKTKFALLGLLALQPMSGYDMKKFIENSLAHFWNVSYGRIYPVLREFETEGLASKSTESQEGRPDRHIYYITDTGREELRAWLSEPAEPHQERIEALLKIFMGANTDVATSIHHIETFRALHQAKLEQLEHVESHLDESQKDNPHYPFWMTTLQCGLELNKAMVRWSDNALKALEKLV